MVKTAGNRKKAEIQQELVKVGRRMMDKISVFHLHASGLSDQAPLPAPPAPDSFRTLNLLGQVEYHISNVLLTPSICWQLPNRVTRYRETYLYQVLLILRQHQVVLNLQFKVCAIK